MTVANVARGVVASILWSAVASAQTSPAAARIESVPLELTMPERYQNTEVLEPIRMVTLVAPRDALVRSITAQSRARWCANPKRSPSSTAPKPRRTPQDGDGRASRETGAIEGKQE